MKNSKRKKKVKNGKNYLVFNKLEFLDIFILIGYYSYINY
jgi:hypothetical protein